MDIYFLYKIILIKRIFEKLNSKIELKMDF